MNSKLAGMLGFALGVGGGWVVCSRLMKEKFQERAEKEIASVKAAFRTEQMEKRKEMEDIPARRSPNGTERRQYRELVREQRYSSTATEKRKERPPMVIDEDDVDDPDNDFSLVTLNYFKDGTLADEKGQPIEPEDIQEWLDGALWKQEFAVDTAADRTPDHVIVRNFALHTDYDILYNDETYKEFLDENPEVVE